MSPFSAPKPAPPVESQSVQDEPVEDADESSKLSMSEKLALFNKLSLPGRQADSPADGPPERRRQKGARYRTQPITVEEVSLVRRYRVFILYVPYTKNLSVFYAKITIELSIPVSVLSLLSSRRAPYSFLPSVCPLICPTDSRPRLST